MKYINRFLNIIKIKYNYIFAFEYDDFYDCKGTIIIIIRKSVFIIFNWQRIHERLTIKSQ